MNNRERWIATQRFERPDRVPLTPGRGRRSTLASWQRQGLPADVSWPNYTHYVRLLAQATGWL